MSGLMRRWLYTQGMGWPKQARDPLSYRHDGTIIAMRVTWQMLRMIDKAAADAKMSRSEWWRQAAAEKIGVRYE